jgi:hypothetical protein
VRWIVTDFGYETHGRFKWDAEFCFGCLEYRSRSLFSSRCFGTDMPADTYPLDSRATAESSVSAISWPAIFGGAIVAASTTLILVLIGSGLGFALVSPWPNARASATTFTVVAGIWLIVVQWLSSGLGGYITGRLRTKWVRIHTHEVFFRDTAHGLLAWGLASVIGAMLLASAGSSAVGTSTRAAASVASGAAQGAGTAAAPLAQQQAYDVDILFRGQKPDAAASGGDVRAETTRIFARALSNGDMPAADRDYLTNVVAERTGLSHDDAQKRVDDVIAQEKAAETKIRQAADTARKSASAFAIFTAISMLIGAFIASAAAAYGGSLRDEHL